MNKQELMNQYAWYAQQASEFWVFEVGATDQQIRKLEKMMELELPDDLKSWFKVCNGGFVIDQGKYESVREVHEVDRFLSVEEIGQYYYALFNLDIELDMSQGRPAFIPFFETKDQSILWVHAGDTETRVWQWTPPLHGLNVHFTMDEFELVDHQLVDFYMNYFLKHTEGYGGFRGRGVNATQVTPDLRLIQSKEPSDPVKTVSESEPSIPMAS